MIIKKVEPKKYIKLRIMATLFDYGIYILLFVTYVYCFGHQNDQGAMEVNGSAALPIFIFWFLYFVVLEAVNQATPGHEIVKLIVVKTSGERITIFDAFKRRILDMFDIGFYAIPALICINKTPKHQRIGDLLADTVVIKRSDITETEVTFRS
jgi:uncharacterized RDD family membrane protein YckC